MILLILISLLFTQYSFAQSASQLDAEVDFAIKKFKQQVPGGANFSS